MIFALGFQTQVQKSSESAKIALETVPEIENQIREVDDKVGEAENVLDLPMLDN